MSDPDASLPSPPLPFDPPLVAAVDSGPLIDLTSGQMLGSAIHGLSVSAVNPATGQGHIVYVSENLAALLGHEPRALLGANPGVLFAEDTPPAQLDAVADLVEQGQQAVVSLRLARRDRTTIRVRASFLRLPAMASDWPYYLSIFRELESQTTQQQLLTASAAILDDLANGHDVTALLHHIAQLLDRQISGGRCWIALADRVGRLDTVIAGPHDPDLANAILAEITESGRMATTLYVRVGELPESLEGRARRAGIEAIWLCPLTGPDGHRRGAMVVAHVARLRPTEVEAQVLEHLARLVGLAVERSVAEAHLAHKVLHDPLTMLPNRMLISDRLEQAVARLGRERARLAVLLVDVDRFKLINDAWGPDVGDEVLVEVSRRLRHSVRLGDTVGRISGDQFMVLCVALTSDHDVQAMAQRIVEAIGEPFHVGHQRQELRISASVGVVLVEEPGHSPNVIISYAESALALAVAGGRARYAVFEKGHANPILVRLELEKALEIALTEDELVVHYQPLVDIKTGRMVGAEALLRWDRPGKGLLPPSEFIEVAEDSGLIVPLGAWVIDEVCRQIAAWPALEDGSRPVISVNLSARQLSDPDLVRYVMATIERHRIPAACLGFEVTESMKVEESEGPSAVLEQLAALGCKVAIDDFGIGYATFEYIRRFSMADTIKIDRSFVNGIGVSRENTAIVATSISLASDLGLHSVAEGVETYDQFAALGRLGCDVAQGYLLSPPVPTDRAIALWQQGQLITPFTP